jgi:SAM-dependent methyltransferase
VAAAGGTLGRVTTDESALRGRPSYVWRAGQDRRLALIQAAASLDGALALDVGCGVGLYTARMAESGATVFGTEVEWDRAVEARAAGLAAVCAPAEALPFRDASFQVVLLHEVLEHVADDRATAAEISRVLADAGRAVVFVPNRWWPFETHGIVWRGAYRFGNAPLVNYLPDPIRNRLAPHVRVYTGRALREVFAGLPLRVLSHTQVFPGYDRLAARKPRLGGTLQRLSCGLEQTPLRHLGLSHLLVLERLSRR